MHNENAFFLSFCVVEMTFAGIEPAPFCAICSETGHFLEIFSFHTFSFNFLIAQPPITGQVGYEILHDIKPYLEKGRPL